MEGELVIEPERRKHGDNGDVREVPSNGGTPPDLH